MDEVKKVETSTVELPFSGFLSYVKLPFTSVAALRVATALLTLALSVCTQSFCPKVVLMEFRKVFTVPLKFTILVASGSIPTHPEAPKVNESNTPITAQFKAKKDSCNDPDSARPMIATMAIIPRKTALPIAGQPSSSFVYGTSYLQHLQHFLQGGQQGSHTQ